MMKTFSVPSDLQAHVGTDHQTCFPTVIKGILCEKAHFDRPKKKTRKSMARGSFS